MKIERKVLMKKITSISILLCLTTLIQINLYAHGGRTDSKGGHYNRKTGEYHYHNSGTSASDSSSRSSELSKQVKPSTDYIRTTDKTPSSDLEQLQAKIVALRSENENQREKIAQLKNTCIELKKENKLMKQTLADANIPLPTLSEMSEELLPELTNNSGLEEGKKDSISISENHWQVALNREVFKGKMEVSVSTGRVDIVTDTQVIEVDKVSKYAEGVEQALKYSAATGKKPVVALYIDGEKDGYDLLLQADKVCKEKGIMLLLANSYVSVNDVIELLTDSGRLLPSTNIAINTENQIETKNISEDLNVNSVSANGDIELKYWITNSSGVRHNSSCRYYENSKGRKCSRNDGRACKICGG